VHIEHLVRKDVAIYESHYIAGVLRPRVTRRSVKEGVDFVFDSSDHLVGLFESSVQRVATSTAGCQTG
jgi:hypothetical protein